MKKTNYGASNAKPVRVPETVKALIAALEKGENVAAALRKSREVSCALCFKPLTASRVTLRAAAEVVFKGQLFLVCAAPCYITNVYKLQSLSCNIRLVKENTQL